MRALALIFLAFCLAGCAGFTDWLAYKLPTRQGNVLEQKQLDQPKVGMTPDKDKFTLEDTMAATPSQNDRWDEVGYCKTPRGPPGAAG